MDKARIFLLDDHVVVRQGLARLIDEQPDLAVCGEAGDLEGALAGIRSADPDLVVADLTLRSGDGWGLLTSPLAEQLPILILSMHDESVYAERALRAGARGYVMKGADADVLLNAIRSTLAGEVFVSDAVQQRALQRLAGDRDGSPQERLTDRELEVFRLVGEGFTPQRIAAVLRISVKTVHAHRSSIMRKLGVQTAPELIHRATRWTLLSTI